MQEEDSYVHVDSIFECVFNLSKYYSCLVRAEVCFNSQTTATQSVHCLPQSWAFHFLHSRDRLLLASLDGIDFQHLYSVAQLRLAVICLSPKQSTSRSERLYSASYICIILVSSTRLNCSPAPPAIVMEMEMEDGRKHFRRFRQGLLGIVHEPTAGIMPRIRESPPQSKSAVTQVFRPRGYGMTRPSGK
jgi:hypothetical protein